MTRFSGPLFAVDAPLRFSSSSDWPLLRSVIELAADRLPPSDVPVRMLSATYLPDEGRMLAIFAAPTSDSVQRLLASAGLYAVRIGRAVVLPDIDRVPTAT